ncbi:MAG: MFS transporter [Dehalococcoidia bacterium]|nr:MFS transporter [Dehalococcoidia bacterium]
MAESPLFSHEGQIVVAPSLTTLRYRDLRLLSLATLVTGAAFLGERVALGWLLLDRTDSALVVGLGVALSALPNFLLGIPGGAITDRFDRRLLLRITSFILAAATAGLGAIALAGMLSVAGILLFTFLSGAVRSLSQTVRQAYAFDVVGPHQAVGGMAIVSLAQRSGGIAGALATGEILVQLGAGYAYVAIALCHLAAFVFVLLARTRGQAAPGQQPQLAESVKEYVREVRGNSTLRALVFLTAAVEILGFSHQAVLPSLARDVLHLDAAGLGLLTALGSLGGFVSVLLVTLRPEPVHKGWFFMGVLLGFGLALVMLGASSSLVVALIGVGVVSALAALSDLLSQTLIQSSVPNELRGRAMGSWMLAIGFGPVGHLQIGAVAVSLGTATALITNGLFLILLAVVVLVWTPQLRKL